MLYQTQSHRRRNWGDRPGELSVAQKDAYICLTDWMGDDRSAEIFDLIDKAGGLGVGGWCADKAGQQPEQDALVLDRPFLLVGIMGS